jgi:uncharacterized protein YkwD
MLTPPVKRFAALLVCLALAACGAPPPPPRETPAPGAAGEPSLYRSLSRGGAEVDAEAARDMISQYRRNHGLNELALDARLQEVASERARAMARRGAVDTRSAGGLAARLKAAGVRGDGAAIENLSAGYDTLAEAFSGWRQSPAHNARMLDPRARRMGLAAVHAPASKFKVFWALVLTD